MNRFITMTVLALMGVLLLTFGLFPAPSGLWKVLRRSGVCCGCCCSSA